METFIIPAISFVGGIILGYWFRHRITLTALEAIHGKVTKFKDKHKRR